MGNTAFNTLLGGKEITKNHGNFIEKDGRMYFVTYHPAATIYNQKLIDELKTDLRNCSNFWEKVVIRNNTKKGDVISVWQRQNMKWWSYQK